MVDPTPTALTQTAKNIFRKMEGPAKIIVRLPDDQDQTKGNEESATIEYLSETTLSCIFS
jgi:hypothetical protein